MSNYCQNEFKYCPICQLPLHAISISPSAHAVQCLSTWDGSELKECPEGVKCLSTNIFHYRDYQHTKLAKYRSSSGYVEPEMVVLCSPKKPSRYSPKKRQKLNPLKSETLKLSHITEPNSNIEADGACNSGSDDDLILPRKRSRKALKYSDSDSSITKLAFVKKNNKVRHCKSVSDAKEQNLVQKSTFTSIDLKQTVSTVTSNSSEVDVLLTDLSDLFSDDNTFYSTESVEDSKSNLEFPAASSNPVSEISSCTSIPKVFNKENCSETVFSCKEVGNSEHTFSNCHSASSVSASDSPLSKSVNTSNDKEKWKNLLRRMRNKNMPSDLNVVTDDSVTYSSSSSSDYRKKQCPFYRRIPGTPFVVDAFQYGDIPEAKVYFLSHFHSDHYIGLKKSFSHPIYCSQITANLVRMKIRVEEHWLNVLSLNQPQIIFGVEVTALDANHCPGSIMLLFRLKDGRNYLHVGDFRASPKMCSYPELKHITISKLFLDTTYCSPQYLFPTQEEIISRVVTVVDNEVAKHSKLLVVCGSYLIGKEKVFLGIAEALDWKIWVRPDKRKIFECLDDPRINSRLAVQGCDARVHVLPMNQINCKSLVEHMTHINVFTHVIGIKPTGWELNSKSDKFRVERYSNCTILGVPYSEHSSYSELRSFVRYIRPEQIIPTVNVGNPASRNKMNKCFQEWMRSSDNKGQITMSTYFTTEK